MLRKRQATLRRRVDGRLNARARDDDGRDRAQRREDQLIRLLERTGVGECGLGATYSGLLAYNSASPRSQTPDRPLPAPRPLERAPARSKVRCALSRSFRLLTVDDPFCASAFSLSVAGGRFARLCRAQLWARTAVGVARRCASTLSARPCRVEQQRACVAPRRMIFWTAGVRITGFFALGRAAHHVVLAQHMRRADQLSMNVLLVDLRQLPNDPRHVLEDVLAQACRRPSSCRLRGSGGNLHHQAQALPPGDDPARCSAVKALAISAPSSSST